MLKTSDPKTTQLDYNAFYKASQPTRSRVTKLDPANFIYTAVVGLTANEFNHNWDYIPESELLSEISDKVAGIGSESGKIKYAWQTWIGRPNPRNHKLEDVARDSYGMVADAHYCPKTKNLFMLLATDRKKDASLVRAIELGLQNSVSAGWGVEYSKCSYCASKAFKEGDYCEHIAHQKGRLLPINKAPDQNWIKHCSDNYPGIVKSGFVRVGEICYGINGMEESWVVNPAFPKAKVVEILKSASIKHGDAEVISDYLKSAGFEDKDIKSLSVNTYRDTLDKLAFKSSPEALEYSKNKRGIYGRPVRNPTWSK